MNKIKELLELAFYSIAIILAFIVVIDIGSEAYKNIRISNKIKDNDICIEVNNELYCRIDYNITFNVI